MGNNIGEADDYIWIMKVRYNAAMRRVRAFENGHAYGHDLIEGICRRIYFENDRKRVSKKTGKKPNRDL